MYNCFIFYLFEWGWQVGDALKIRPTAVNRANSYIYCSNTRKDLYDCLNCVSGQHWIVVYMLMVLSQNIMEWPGPSIDNEMEIELWQNGFMNDNEIVLAPALNLHLYTLHCDR